MGVFCGFYLLGDVSFAGGCFFGLASCDCFPSGQEPRTIFDMLPAALIARAIIICLSKSRTDYSTIGAVLGTPLSSQVQIPPISSFIQKNSL